MRIIAGLVVVGALAAAGMANAEGARLSDVAYMQAARCEGLASSGKIDSKVDAAAVKAMLRSQMSGRQPYVLDKADEMQRAAKRQADRADDIVKMQLAQELNGVCSTLQS